MDEPIIPYSINSLNQVVANAPLYQAVLLKYFAVPGPLPISNADKDAVLNCLTASKYGATNRENPLAFVFSNSPARPRKADKSTTPVAMSPNATITTSSPARLALRSRSPARGR